MTDARSSAAVMLLTGAFGFSFPSGALRATAELLEPVGAVDILLSEDRSKLPALTCLPVTYRPGGTTRDETK